MTAAQLDLPAVDRKLVIPEFIYTDPVTQDTYKSPAGEVKISNGFLRVPNANYFQAVKVVPKGYRMSDLEEITYLIQRERELKAKGKSPREVLNDLVFDRFVRRNPYLWMWSDRALRAPNGARSFSKYKEVHDNKRYFRGDFIIGDKVVAEGVRIPKSFGDKVIAWNDALRLPAEVSDVAENHTTHFYFDADKQEVALSLSGSLYHDEYDRCLNFVANWGRSSSGEDAALRLVEGSLEFPSVEYFVRNQ